MFVWVCVLQQIYTTDQIIKSKEREGSAGGGGEGGRILAKLQEFTEGEEKWSTLKGGSLKKIIEKCFLHHSLKWDSLSSKNTKWFKKVQTDF